MPNYGALPSTPSGTRAQRSLLSVGVLCVVAAVLAVSTLHAYNGKSVLFQAPTEAQMLAELSKSDKMLASAKPAESTKPANVHMKLQSAAVLKKAAEMLEKSQEKKIEKAAAQLEHEEAAEVEVKKAANKLVAQAREEEQKEKADAIIAQEKASVDASFEASKKNILAEAAAAIAAQEAKKNEVENAIVQKAASTQQLGNPKLKQPYGANDDAFLNFNAPLEQGPTRLSGKGELYDSFANMDPPIVVTPGKPLPGAKKKGTARPLLKIKTQTDSTANAKPKVENVAAGKALAADEQVSALEAELQKAKAKAAEAEQAMLQHLSAAPLSDEELEANDKEYTTGSEGDDWKPTFYEDYDNGKLGPMAESKRIPEDHPIGHKKCRFHDIDCDEMWPWGKQRVWKDEPPVRYGKLGDNMIGTFGQDDVVVPTGESGLILHAKPYVDQFDHWPEDSKKNKDLLYGNARKIISQQYTGVGDVYVPIQRLEKMESKRHPHGQPLADLFFGSWQQGFTKPHDHTIRKSLNMFDQPFRQHYASATGQGHQIYKVAPKQDISNQYGGTFGLGPSKGDDDDNWIGNQAQEEDNRSPSNLPNAFDLGSGPHSVNNPEH